MLSLIVAYETNFGIGNKGQIPWKNEKDMKFFRETTANSVLIMGRKTYESIIQANKMPLKDRIHIVISTQETQKIEGNHEEKNAKTHQTSAEIHFVKSPKDAATLFATRFGKSHKGFVIGGEQIYHWFLSAGYVRTEYATQIKTTYDCDTFYNFPKNMVRLSSETVFEDEKIKISKNILGQQHFEEQTFLDLGKEILTKGDLRMERTGKGAYSLFGHQLKFDLTNNTFPLLTTRKMFLTGIFEELMFYLRGQTDNEILEKKGIKVWSANTTREFLDARGLQHLPVGDMGPSYGFLFRHFGATYKTSKDSYKGQGTDQLAELIHKLKTNPTDRRLIISLWDPNNKDRCPLPPCLYNYQFYVRGKKLSCMMTQRSSDYAVAGGWNIATGALFTILLAAVCDLEPENLIWNIGDAHLYTNVVDGFKEQLQRQPRLFPKIFVPKRQNIEDFQKEDLILLGYEPHDTIKFQMNA